MGRKIPVPADVRAAIADVRRARSTAAEPAPEEVTRVEWRTAAATCVFCGNDGSGAATRGLFVCSRTLGELTALPPVPAGPDVDRVLETLERWMAPRDGEPSAAPWPLEIARCSACGRAAEAVPQLFAAEGTTALCSACVERAAALAPDPAARDEVLRAESDAARRELDDLDRIRREIGKNAGIRGNASAALSLLRMLSIPDDATRTRLLEVLAALET